MSQYQLTEIQIQSLDEEMFKVPPKDFQWLHSSVAHIRIRAYQSIKQVLTSRIEEDATVHAVPLFLAQTWDSLSALNYLLSEWDVSGSIDPDIAIPVLRRSYDAYGRILHKTQELSEGITSWHSTWEEFKYLQGILTKIKKSITKLLKILPEQNIQHYKTSAEYAEKVEENPQKAIKLYEKLMNEDDGECTPEMFLKIGNLYEQIEDKVRALHTYIRGYQETRSIELFEQSARYGIVTEGEEDARIFYELYFPDGYKMPFSYLRWTIIDDSELADIETVITVFFQEGHSDRWNSSYIRQVSKYVQERLDISKEDWYRNQALIASKDSSFPTDVEIEKCFIYLELLEYQIFYLLEFKNLKGYLATIEKQLKTQQGLYFLSEYFRTHTLSPLSRYLLQDKEDDVESEEDTPVKKRVTDTIDHEVKSPWQVLKSWDDDELEATTSTTIKMNDTIDHDEVSPWQTIQSWTWESGNEDGESNGRGGGFLVHPDVRVGLRQEISRRYSYLSMRIASHDPLYSYIDPTSDTNEPISSLREELTIISNQLKTIIFEDERWMEPFVLEQKVRAEEYRMEHIGSEALVDYSDIVSEIDEQFSVTERRYIAYHARLEEFTWENLPDLCMRHPLLGMFFISERLLAGYGGHFHDELDKIMREWQFLTLPTIHILTFTELLMSQGFIMEAFNLLVNSEDALFDVDSLFILTELLLRMGEWTEEYKECRNIMETLIVKKYGRDNMEEVILEVYHAQKVAMSTPSEYLDEQEMKKQWVSMIAYIFWVFLRDINQELSDLHIQEAIWLWLPEALYYRALLDMQKEGSDRENILDGLILTFPKALHPIRGAILSLIVLLAWERKERDVFLRYAAIARSEWVGIWSSCIWFMIDFPEQKELVYTLFLTSSFAHDLEERDFRKLQELIHNDIWDHATPLMIRLRASFLKTRIASHEQYGYIPAIFEYWSKINELLHSTSRAEFHDEFSSFIKEIYPEYQVPGIENVRFVNALHFQAVNIRWKIVQAINEAQQKDNTQIQKGLIIYYTFFCDICVDMFRNIPSESSAIYMKLEEGDRSYSSTVFDYWSYEQDRMYTSVYNLEHADNPRAIVTPYTHNAANVSNFPIHPILQ
jgi:hypothetical protein